MRHVVRVNPVPLGLVQFGPLIEVVLSPHPIAAEKIVAAGGKPISLRTKLMIDTGAQKTVVENVIAESLKIPPIRHVPMVGVSQKPEMCPLYMMSIGFLMGDGTNTEALMFSSEVVGMNTPPSRTEHCGLLGRDFLAHFRLVYDGPSGMFEVHKVGGPPSTPQITPAQAAAEGPLSRQERRRLERKGK